MAFVLSMLLCIYGMHLTENDQAANSRSVFRMKRTETGIPAALPVEGRAKVSFRSLLLNRKFVFYLVIFALFNGVNEAMNTFVPSMLTSEGVEPSMASTILSIAVLMQLPMVYFADKFMDRMKNKTLSLAAFGIMLTQMLVYGLPAMLGLKEFVIMLLKTQGSMLFIMVNLKIVHSLVSSGSQITALAIAATVKNLAAIVFNSMAGNMIDALGYSSCFLALAAVMIVAIILLLVFRLPAGTDQKLFS
ncbi:MFS transporter [Ileibacterium valens]|uniref:MFS transporter n=1 Tax=Ileibacterium valens TaxID=1862668 RepID=UPI002352F4F9|nr:MFS transporter [Ileibacterium valens]